MSTSFLKIKEELQASHLEVSALREQVDVMESSIQSQAALSRRDAQGFVGRLRSMQTWHADENRVSPLHCMV